MTRTTQTLIDFRGREVQGPTSCEGCADETVDLDQRHNGDWLCPTCFVGATCAGLDALALETGDFG